MDARPKTVAEILQTGSDQYLVPFFQRHYKWTRKEWERLLLDAMRLLEQPSATSRHFLGSMVCTPHQHVPGEVNSYQLIDGQQRLTTLTIFLTALRDVAKSTGQQQIVEQIHEGFLIHKWRSGTSRFRVVPRTGDRDVLFGIIDGNPPKASASSRIKRALNYFARAIEEFTSLNGGPEAALPRLLALIASRLSLVVITIDDENPYEIFGSLNGKGLPLRQSDLIRNFVFMQVPLEEQEEFNNSNWDQLEGLLEETSTRSSATDATRFYRYFLMRDGVYVRTENVFIEFQGQYKSREYTPGQVCSELTHFAHIYRTIRDPARADDTGLRLRLKQFRKLDQATCHPLLMHLIRRWELEQLGADSLYACLDDGASFILRRSICGESTRPYSRLFAEAITQLGNDAQSSLRKFLLSKQWPDDAAFVPALVRFDLYRRERKMTDLILSALEGSYGSKEPVDLDTSKITIEHIMPRNITSGSDAVTWRSALGADWEQVHKAHIHTIGNLTLTGYNSELSNSSFEKKKELFNKSNLVLNREFEQQDAWDAEAIVSRGEALAENVAKLWPRPDGEPYIPTEQVTQEERRFYTDFWTSFLDLWSQRHPGEDRPGNVGRTWIIFRASRRPFWFSIQVDTDQSVIWIALYGRGRFGNQYLATIYDEIPDGVLESLDDQLQTEYDYHDSKDEDVDQIFVEKSIESFDRKSWTAVHRWLVPAFDSFRATLEPFISEFNRSDYDWSEDDGAKEVNGDEQQSNAPSESMDAGDADE